MHSKYICTYWNYISNACSYSSELGFEMIEVVSTKHYFRKRPFSALTTRWIMFTISKQRQTKAFWEQSSIYDITWCLVHKKAFPLSFSCWVILFGNKRNNFVFATSQVYLFSNSQHCSLKNLFWHSKCISVHTGWLHYFCYFVLVEKEIWIWAEIIAILAQWRFCEKDF